jgi:hypothetical protein
MLPCVERADWLRMYVTVASRNPEAVSRCSTRNGISAWRAPHRDLYRTSLLELTAIQLNEGPHSTQQLQ